MRPALPLDSSEAAESRGSRPGAIPTQQVLAIRRAEEEPVANSIKRIRTIALVGQAGSGKTSLTEALLAKAGAIPAAGSVERGTTVGDYTPLEKQLQHSLKLSVASFEAKVEEEPTRIHLLDTPGYPDFLGNALPALAAVETAAIVINAQNGVEMMTGRFMAWAQKRGLDRVIIVNKIDAENVDCEDLLERIQQAFGSECLPLNLPAGGNSKVSDCFFAPSGEADFSSVAEAHQKLIDQVVEVDEKLMEKYLEKGEVSPAEVHEAIPGDICAIAKIDEIQFDHILHDSPEDAHVHARPLELPTSVFGLAVTPKKRGDEQKVSDVMHKIAAEDPCFRIEHNAQANETVMRGLGEMHLKTVLQKMSTQYKLDLDTRPPSIAFRETIAARADGHSRHKKQTGGAGQFGEVFLKIEPLPRGKGFELVDGVKGGSIPNQFIPSAGKGVRSVPESGFVAAYRDRVVSRAAMRRRPGAKASSTWDYRHKKRAPPQLQ